MPTFIAGKDNKVFFGAFDLSAFFNSANFSREQASIETTTFNSDQATFISGVETASASLGGFFDGSTDAVDEELKAVIGATNPTPLSIYQGGDTAGTKLSY